MTTERLARAARGDQPDPFDGKPGITLGKDGKIYFNKQAVLDLRLEEGTKLGFEHHYQGKTAIDEITPSPRMGFERKVIKSGGRLTVSDKAFATKLKARTGATRFVVSIRRKQILLTPLTHGSAD